jgi:hypothetical protein
MISGHFVADIGKNADIGGGNNPDGRVRAPRRRRLGVNLPKDAFRASPSSRQPPSLPKFISSSLAGIHDFKFSAYKFINSVTVRPGRATGPGHSGSRLAGGVPCKYCNM